MRATEDDILYLQKIQQINQDIAERLRVYEDLPEKGEFVVIAKKEQEINEKLTQVQNMKKDAESRYEKLLIEDSQLLERESSVQHSIDEAAGDFRNLEVRTKELDGIASRRSLLADMILKVDEEQEKINSLIKTLTDADTKIKLKKEELNEKILNNKAEAESFVEQHSNELDSLFSKLPCEIAEAYKKASSKVGSVVLSEIEGDRCKVCKSTLETGTLLDLEAAGNVGVCPHCERILLIEN